MFEETHARLHVKYPLSSEFNPTRNRQQFFVVIKNITSYRIKQFIIYNNTLAIKLTIGNNSVRGFINLINVILKARRCLSLSPPPPPKKVPVLHNLRQSPLFCNFRYTVTLSESFPTSQKSLPNEDQTVNAVFGNNG